MINNLRTKFLELIQFPILETVVTSCMVVTIHYLLKSLITTSYVYLNVYFPLLLSGAFLILLTLYPAKIFKTLGIQKESNSVVIDNHTFNTTIVLLFILKFAFSFHLGITPAVLMIWSLVCDKNKYYAEDIVTCCLLSTFISKNLLSMAYVILTHNFILYNLSIVALCCTLPIICAYNYYKQNINIGNLFCLKKPKPNQLHKIFIQFIGYSIPIITLLYASNVLSLIFNIAINVNYSAHLYILLLFQTYYEETIFRLFLIKACVNEDNSVDSLKATLLSFGSSLLFAYAHRYDGTFTAIMASTNLVKASILCFLYYSGEFIMVGICNIFKRANIIPTWITHYYKKVISFSLSFTKDKYSNIKSSSQFTIMGSCKYICSASILVVSLGELSLYAMKKVGIDSDIEYEDNKKPTLDAERPSSVSFIYKPLH